MGEKFFYDWTEDYVWSVIESTFDEPLWQQNKVDKEKVKEEFDKLKGTLLVLKVETRSVYISLIKLLI